MPAPGSPAERALEERRKRRGKVHKKLTVPGLSNSDDDVQDAVEGTDAQGGATSGEGGPAKPSGQRQQPKRKKRKR